LTWTGNAVSVQAGGEFRLPLIVPHPSILAIQFEVEGGADIEFSLYFHDEQVESAHPAPRRPAKRQTLEPGVPPRPTAASSAQDSEASTVLVEPVRVADREGQLDIDTTGVCEIVWSNAHAWMSSKVLSYQLQLAPKVNTQMRKFRRSVISASDDYRVLAAAEAADEIDRSMRTLKQRTSELEVELNGKKEKVTATLSRHERYLTHVKRLEEEVAAAKAHAAQAEGELGETRREVAAMERKLEMMVDIRSLDGAIDAPALDTLAAVDEALELLFEAYAGAMCATSA
jgi:hypothetical protein